MGFRGRLIEKDLDRRLVGRTVELAARTKGFGARGQAVGTAVVAAEAGVPQLTASSLKAALDRD